MKYLWLWWILNICMALFHIFGANYIYIHPITNIFGVYGKYLCPFSFICIRLLCPLSNWVSGDTISGKSAIECMLWRWRTPHSLHPLLKAEIVLCIRLLNILILRKHWKYNVHWVKVHPDLLRSKLHQFNLSANRTTSTSTGTLISTVAKYFTEIIQVPLLGTH